MEVDRVTGSIYSADPRVDRHHLISISSYHPTKIHTVSFPTFGLTRSVWEFVDSRICVDPQCRVVSYLLTQFLRCSNQKPSFSLFLFGCRERCDEVLMVGSLPSSSKWCMSKFSQWACAGAPPIMLDYHLRTDWPYVYIYRQTKIMHAILWCSESCDCNKDKYEKTKCLLRLLEPLLWE